REVGGEHHDAEREQEVAQVRIEAAVVVDGGRMHGHQAEPDQQADADQERRVEDPERHAQVMPDRGAFVEDHERPRGLSVRWPIGPVGSRSGREGAGAGSGAEVGGRRGATAPGGRIGGSSSSSTTGSGGVSSISASSSGVSSTAGSVSGG